jgi:hypothetical protein
MYRWIILAFLALCLALPAHAGSSEAGRPQLPADEVAAFSNRVQQDLAARGAHVAIVARMGRNPDLLPAGVRYTHVSFWVLSQIKTADGKTGTGYRAYNLYQQGQNGTRSKLVQDSPADFFAGAYRFDAGIIIPDIRLQKKLLAVITSPTYAKLHNPRYSVLANPFTSEFQNCTEHTLDVIMSAIYGTRDIAQIKANEAAYFKPQVIAISGVKRALAPVASQALTTSDHGPVVATATFGSIARFMKANGLASQVYRLTPEAAYRY